MTRNTHDRLNDHFGTDKDTNVVLVGSLSAPASTASGSTVHQALADLNSAIGGVTGGVIVEDEGTPLATTATTLNFTGAGITASGTGATKTIDVPGGGGGGSSNSYIVRVVATANGTFSTAFANGQTLDGITLATGDRILLAAQSTASQRGIYTVNASGSPTRATDYNSQSAIRGSIIETWDGNNAFSLWANTNTGAITVGSTGLSFQKLADIKILTILAARTTLAGPGGTSYATVGSDYVELDGVHTPGNLSNKGVQMILGNDGLALTFNEKDGSNVQIHTSFGSFSVLLVDQSGSLFKHVSVDGDESVPAVGRLRTLASAPSSPAEGDSYYDTTLHKTRTWDGSAWQNSW